MGSHNEPYRKNCSTQLYKLYIIWTRKEWPIHWRTHHCCITNWNKLLYNIHIPKIQDGVFSTSNANTNTDTSIGLYFMSLWKLVLFFSNQDWNSTYNKWHTHHECYVEYITCQYKVKLYCINQCIFAYTVSAKLLWRD